MESATRTGDRRSSIEPPRSSAQIETEIGRLKRQTTRVVSPEHQRYRALLRESLLMEIARLEREKAHALRLEDQRRGALLRRYLAGRNAPAIRALLRRIVDARDRHLFDL